MRTLTRTSMTWGWWWCVIDELLNPCKKSCYSCINTGVFCRTDFASAITCDTD
jgi:hypothetical protein